ncbi:MAG: hypothetical protein J5855_10580 [Mailhella sp.]|nr:hypothetical protein [Mailhella sp.]
MMTRLEHGKAQYERFLKKGEDPDSAMMRDLAEGIERMEKGLPRMEEDPWPDGMPRWVITLGGSSPKEE